MSLKELKKEFYSKTNTLNIEPVVSKRILASKKDNFLGVFDFLNTNKNSKDLVHFKTIDSITKMQLDVIEQASILRNLVNEDKGIFKIDKYRRKDQSKKDFSAMIVEYTMSKMLWEKHKYVKKEDKKSIKLTGPAMASFILSHKKEDFVLEKENESIMFDTKSQYLNDFEYLTINKEAHDKFLEHESDFYMVGIIECGDYSDFKNIKKIHFFLMSKEFFDENSELCEEKRSESFTPHYRIKMELFRNKIQNDL